MIPVELCQWSRRFTEHAPQRIRTEFRLTGSAVQLQHGLARDGPCEPVKLLLRLQ